MIPNSKAGKDEFRIVLFFLPIFISVVYLLGIFLFLDNETFPIIGLLILSYFISPFGKEILIPVAMAGLFLIHGTSMPLFDICITATSVIFVDVMCSLFLVWNLELLTKIPKIGDLIYKFEKVGRQRFNKKKRSRNVARLGLTAYVALPFQGSGGIVSSIIGLMAGMSERNVFLSVLSGSIIGCFSIAVPAYFIGEKMSSVFGSPISYIIGVLVLVSVVVFLILRYLRNRDFATDD